MRDHGSIGLFLGHGVFLVGTLALSVLGLFLFCFGLLWGEQVTDTQDFGWQSKGEDHFRSWFPFFLCLLGDNSVFADLWSRIFFPFFAFSHSSIENFLFLFSPALLIGNFLSFLFSSEGKDWHSHPGSRFMVNLDFGSRLVALLDMIYVRVWFGSRIKGDVPHYFHDTNATMMIWKFYAKLVVHAPMWTLKCRKIFGHVMRGLIIHCLYFSQPSVSKIRSFINKGHPSLYIGKASWDLQRVIQAFI